MDQAPHNLENVKPNVHLRNTENKFDYRNDSPPQKCPREEGVGITVMPSATLNRPKRSEEMWETLKVYIIKQRQKKKQEQEADEEVERQRKERERQQKQDVMTLGETREQILQLEMRLKELKDEKHQLFLQLKKVLNEDDNRRRQLVKENNDMMSLHGYPAVAISGHPQLFLQQSIPLAGRAPIYKVAPQHTLLPPGTLKRSRSPSPPPQSYHQGYGYKPGTIPGYSTQKLDDGRRGHEYVRAVLWNSKYKAPQPNLTLEFCLTGEIPIWNELMTRFVKMATYWRAIPDLVLGTLSMLGALLCLLLPETLNKTLPVTLEDVESISGRRKASGNVRAVRRKKDKIHPANKFLLSIVLAFSYNNCSVTVIKKVTCLKYLEFSKNTQYSGSQPFYSPQGQSSTAVSYTPTHTQTVYTYAAPGYIQQPGSVQVREGSPKQAPHGVYLGHTGALPAHTQQVVLSSTAEDGEIEVRAQNDRASNQSVLAGIEEIKSIKGHRSKKRARNDLSSEPWCFIAAEPDEPWERRRGNDAPRCSNRHVDKSHRNCALAHYTKPQLARYNSPTLLRWNTRRGPLDREYGGNRYHYGLTKTSGIHQPRPLRTSHQHDYKTGKEWRVESSIPNQGIQSQIANRGWFNSQPSKREEGSLEQHGSNKPPANFSSSQEGADKFYTPVRAATHVPIHGGVIPIQQPPQGSKTGGITTGYPIRAQPGATTGNYQPVVSSSHNVYVTQAPSTRLLYTSQPNPSQTSQPRYTVQQREI
uniref:G protein pathway suppressor 2 n=1 Tax=Timema tahoe TaxID=61484 RepID=A0A7R9IDV5_9NEOP|nr:unnamed protein product [Timema tahoe]